MTTSISNEAVGKKQKVDKGNKKSEMETDRFSYRTNVQ